MARGTRLLLAALMLVLTAASAEALDPPSRRAVERGVEALRRFQGEDGSFPQNQIGATALAAWTMLECEVPATDPVIQKAAQAVRKMTLRSDQTYSLSLAIIFLDRLGDPNDVPLIQILAVRLLSGMTISGGWGYTCPGLMGEAELRRLDEVLKQQAKLVGGVGAPKNVAEGTPERKELPKELMQAAANIQRAPLDPNNPTDNSNTQFAILGLWVASRHGVPIDQAVARFEHGLRTTQNKDGGWPYLHIPRPDIPSTPAMTCAGLLGLAVGHAQAKTKAPRDLARDPAIQAGLAALGTAIDHPVNRKAPNAKVPIVGNNGRFYYFLWSLERVSMIYGLDTIGGKDWYAWGNEILLANQRPDGQWEGEFKDCGADTCFALLFLVKANPLGDLSTALRGSLKDPGSVVLRSGGVDGANLQSPRLTPALDPKKSAAGAPTTGRKPDDKLPTLPDPASFPVKPPVVSGDPETTRLTARLVEARGAQQDDALAALRDGKGVTYTQALSAAVHQLNGEAKSKARTALAERLTRMAAVTLADKLEDDDAEVRRAAALALAMKEDRSQFPKLIDLLADKEPAVVRAAHAALKSLSGQDFGPTPDASPADRARAVAAWKNWWAAKKVSGPFSPRKGS